MPSWHDLLNEIKAKGSTYDMVRRQYLQNLHDLTGRNVIVYYSGWLQKPKLPGTQVTDADKTGFMTVIHELDRTKGLDLILHTPGGETAATESLVDYLRGMFGKDIRAVVPELAMSAGTMIACACREIMMGKHSSLGPIDPQLAGMPAHGIVEEFNRAHKEIKADQSRAYVWQPIIAKYNPTLVGECEKAIQWSTEMTKAWLLSGMLEDLPDAEAKADAIIAELGDHALTKSHARHLGASRCREIGLNVSSLEADQRLQEAVLSVHHACIHTLTATGAFKIIENHRGVASMSVLQHVVVQGPVQSGDD
jgi:ATP-dependent protease ClpP protease subunit